MSIERKDRKQYNIEFRGSRADFAAIADVLATAEKRVHLDLHPKEKDIPGRINVSEGTAFQISRVKKAMRAMSEGLKTDDAGVAINLGDVDIMAKHHKDEWLDVMDSVTSSNNTTIKSVGMPVVDAMERLNMFTVKGYAEAGEGRTTMLTDMNMEWIYAEPLIGPELTSKELGVKSMAGIEGLDKYPPKLNEKELKRWAKSKGYNRAYIVLVKTDKWYPLASAVHTKPGDWNKLIRNLAGGTAILKEYEGKPPKDMAQLLARVAAYSSGRAFDMKNVTVAPFDVSKLGTMPSVGREQEKVFPKPNVLITRKDPVTEEKYPDYTNFIGFLVVGKGPYKSMGLTRVLEEDTGDLSLPDL